MSLSAVSDITVERVVKKKTPKKHFVFSIQVEWKDGVIIRIYRSYDDTLTLQKKLQEAKEFNSYLANEAAENRTGYLLQDKSLFGKLTIKTRNQTRRRMIEVEEFLKSVVHLPSHISTSDVVTTFFTPVPDDLLFVEPAESYDDNWKETRGSRRKGYPVHISEPILLDQYVAISDYDKMDNNDLNLIAGNIVEVIHKGDHGWWFVDLDGDLGWVPASYLEPRDGYMDDQIMENFGEEEVYIAMATYKPEFNDEIKLEIGKLVQVKQKKVDGWWLVKCDNDVGWVPCMHLHELSTSSTKAYAREVGREKAMLTMNNIFAITDRRRTWNPTLPPKRLSAFKSTVRRGRFGKEDTIQEEDEEKPSYMNMEFHKKNGAKTTKNIPNNNNNNNDEDPGKEAGPSYINLEFHQKENKKDKKKRQVSTNNEKEEGPSYINMEFHKKNEQANRQRMRRRRDDDDDLVEIDFDKVKQLNSQSNESSSKPRLSGKEITKDNGCGEKDEEERKEGIEKKNDLDSEDGYESPPSVPAQKGTEKALKTDRNEQGSEMGTYKGTSLDEPHDEGLKEEHTSDPKILLSEPTDESKDTTSGSNIFLAIDDYTKESESEVSLQNGASVEVLEQSEGGWWLVRTQSLSIGWAPSNFLEKISNEELDKRKELGLESPARPPLRPPKSPRVQRMAQHVSSEQRFWSFVRKNDTNNATCSIVDEKQVCQLSDDGQQNLMVMGSNGSKVGEYDDSIRFSSNGIEKDYICDPQTGVCKLQVESEQNSKL